MISAGAHATLYTLLNSSLMGEIEEKEALFRVELKHPKIKKIHGRGLMLAPILEDAETVQKVVEKSLEKGLILFFLLWEKKEFASLHPLT